MMATDNHELNSVNENNNHTSKSKPKRSKRFANGSKANGKGSIVEAVPNLSPKPSNNDDDILTKSNISEDKTIESSEPLGEPLTPVVSTQTTSTARDNSSKYTGVTLTTVQDEDDDDEERDERKNIQPVDRIITDSDEKPNVMVQSITSASVAGDNVIEIHEFTLADLDAYLDIYFDTLNNRLQRYIGSSEDIKQFRNELKTRISSNENAREFQNVLLGKINGDVVAAVTLSFPGEAGTILDTNVLSQSNSCFTSILRWMTKNANYAPTTMEECYIEMIGVKSSCRNHGIGTAMLECVEHFAQQAGANILTVHVNNDLLRNYFQRFGFQLDSTDNSSFWKWMVERTSTTKMSKILPPSDEYANNSLDNTSSYINESVAGSEL